MPRYYEYGGRPHRFESAWPGWPMPPVKAAPGSTLSGDRFGSLGDGSAESAAAPLQSGDVFDIIDSRPVRMLSAGAMAYHGYRRTGSAWWAIGWWIFGGWMPIVAPALALAQGFGKPKRRSNPKKRKRLTTLAAYVPPQKKKQLAKKQRLRTAAGKRRQAAAKRGWKKRRKRERKDS